MEGNNLTQGSSCGGPAKGLDRSQAHQREMPEMGDINTPDRVLGEPLIEPSTIEAPAEMCDAIPGLAGKQISSEPDAASKMQVTASSKQDTAPKKLVIDPIKQRPKSHEQQTVAEKAGKTFQQQALTLKEGVIKSPEATGNQKTPSRKVSIVPNKLGESPDKLRRAPTELGRPPKSQEPPIKKQKTLPSMDLGEVPMNREGAHKYSGKNSIMQEMTMRHCEVPTELEVRPENLGASKYPVESTTVHGKAAIEHDVVPKTPEAYPEYLEEASKHLVEPTPLQGEATGEHGVLSVVSEPKDCEQASKHPAESTMKQSNNSGEKSGTTSTKQGKASHRQTSTAQKRQTIDSSDCDDESPGKKRRYSAYLRALRDIEKKEALKTSLLASQKKVGKATIKKRQMIDDTATTSSAEKEDGGVQKDKESKGDFVKCRLPNGKMSLCQPGCYNCHSIVRRKVYTSATRPIPFTQRIRALPIHMTWQEGIHTLFGPTPGVNPLQAYICRPCSTAIRKMLMAHMDLKKLGGPNPGLKLDRPKELPSKPKKKISPRVTQRSIFNMDTPASKQLVLGGIKQRVRREMYALRKSAPREEVLAPFSWQDYVTRLSVECPVFHAALLGALTKFRDDLYTRERVPVENILGPIAATILSQVHRIKFSRFPTLMSLHLRACGAATKHVISCLNSVGFCVTRKKLEQAEAQVLNTSENTVCKWRADWEKASSPGVEIVPGSTMMTEEKRLRMLEDDHCYNIHLSTDTSHTYTLCFDDAVNYQQDSNGKKIRRTSIITIASMDRIPPTPGLCEVRPSPEDILSIPLQALLPSRQDVLDDFEERKRIVARILTRWLDCFEPLQEEAARAIHHPYLAESAIKSTVAPVGMVLPTSAGISEARVTTHLGYLQKYVPHCFGEDGPPSQMVIYGDSLATRATMNVVGRREPGTTNFVPAYSDYHKNSSLMQDAIDDLFKIETSSSPGTMANLQKIIRKRSTSGKVDGSYSESREILINSAEAYIIAAAMDYLSLNSLRDSLETPDMEPSALMDRLSTVSEHIARLSCQTESLEAFVQAAAWPEDDDEYDRHCHCLCQCEKIDTMVECCNQECPSGQWFHVSCLRLREDALPKGEWFCSRRCRSAVHPIWKESDATGGGLDDKVFEYTRAVLWHGLNLLTRMDAIAENDGVRMIRHWKYDLMPLYQRHRILFLLAHHFVLAVEGGCSERIAHQLTWSRTVNPRGEPGKNIPINEHLIHYKDMFREAVRASEGSVSDEVLQRRGKVMLAAGGALSSVYPTDIISKNNRHYHRIHMAAAIEALLKAKVSHNIVGRAHPGFLDFRFDPYENIDPDSFGESLMLDDLNNQGDT